MRHGREEDWHHKGADPHTESGEITKCRFDISFPGNSDCENTGTVDRIRDILDRNHVGHQDVDSVPGACNLDRIWIETGEMDCGVEYCGVYPVNWDPEDIVEFERMEKEGLITVFVYQMVDGKHIPNH